MSRRRHQVRILVSAKQRGPYRGRFMELTRSRCRWYPFLGRLHQNPCPMSRARLGRVWGENAHFWGGAMTSGDNDDARSNGSGSVVMGKCPMSLQVNVTIMGNDMGTAQASERGRTPGEVGGI